MLEKRFEILEDLTARIMGAGKVTDKGIAEEIARRWIKY